MADKKKRCVCVCVNHTRFGGGGLFETATLNQVQSHGAVIKFKRHRVDEAIFLNTSRYCASTTSPGSRAEADPMWIASSPVLVTIEEEQEEEEEEERRKDRHPMASQVQKEIVR
jgi:hypothetical protein